ncbi:MAG: 50S ribosomal protein L17, partial [Candidatus Omnitrophica bacterium]|nr:50S ribosomal protein L17 [Candidatus Omnitrophota bacterium]
MRHRKQGFQLNRFTSWRRATLVSLARNLFLHQSIRTTKVKARAAQQLAERLIALAKTNTLSAKRQAHKILNDHQLVKMLFSDIASRFQNRQSGFT